MQCFSINISIWLCLKGPYERSSRSQIFDSRNLIEQLHLEFLRISWRVKCVCCITAGGRLIENGKWKKSSSNQCLRMRSEGMWEVNILLPVCNFLRMHSCGKSIIRRPGYQSPRRTYKKQTGKILGKKCVADAIPRQELTFLGGENATH